MPDPDRKLSSPRRFHLDGWHWCHLQSGFGPISWLRANRVTAASNTSAYYNSPLKLMLCGAAEELWIGTWYCYSTRQKRGACPLFIYPAACFCASVLEKQTTSYMSASDSKEMQIDQHRLKHKSDQIACTFLLTPFAQAVIPHTGFLSVNAETLCHPTVLRDEAKPGQSN